ncbi:uncharacterized protein LOC143257665 [Tachypleus tridentatus]|uniref:uncharacterized protein LOC143257665 n=1 Tax=Tachypleus tridentatus TaxID=6853 RepID=UPI003FD4536F
MWVLKLTTFFICVILHCLQTVVERQLLSELKKKKNFGIAATYWSIEYSLVTTIITYGVIDTLELVFCYGYPVVTAVETYGQTLIEDDTFLSVVGFVAGAVHALSRVTVGLIQDKISYKLFPKKKGFVTGIVASGHSCIKKSSTKTRDCRKTINDEKLSTSFKETPASSYADDQQPYRNNEAELHVSPTEALKMKEFYHLSMTYGQTFIKDDTFLSIVGSVARAVHALSRVTVGLIQDKISYKTVFLFTMVATSLEGKVTYMIWICGLHFTFSLAFVCIPAAVAEQLSGMVRLYFQRPDLSRKNGFSRGIQDF